MVQAGSEHIEAETNGRHFADDIFKRIFFNENAWISITISLKFVPKGPINNIPPLVQIMVCRRPGDKPLSEPMMVNLPTHICVVWPQWVNTFDTSRQKQNYFADDTFKRIFMREDIRISIKISLKFVPKFWINSIFAWVQTMAWSKRSNDGSFLEPMMVSLPTHVSVPRTQIWYTKKYTRATYFVVSVP